MEQAINEDQEANLERVNMHLERLLDRDDQDLSLLRNMAFHYRVRNMSAQARIRNLKAKLRKATRRGKEAKEQDRLRIFAKGFLGSVWHRIENLQPKFQEIWGIFGHFTKFWAKDRVFLPKF